MSGRYKKDECRLVNFYCPTQLELALKTGVRKIDSDNSKFIRIAIREKLERHGISVPDELLTKESKP